jgi:hypothetical protein
MSSSTFSTYSRAGPVERQPVHDLFDVGGGFDLRADTEHVRQTRYGQVAGAPVKYQIARARALTKDLGEKSEVVFLFEDLPFGQETFLDHRRLEFADRDTLADREIGNLLLAETLKGEFLRQSAREILAPLLFSSRHTDQLQTRPPKWLLLTGDPIVLPAQRSCRDPPDYEKGTSLSRSRNTVSCPGARTSTLKVIGWLSGVPMVRSSQARSPNCCCQVT